ncbi:MAG: glycosyltransferase family 2 protein [Patescibacteria group bacterium]|nr:glycosyltransferase family 2 protein [Patescibacteria group bacterium]
MRKYKRISIIIPVYNEANFIEKTIKAVIKSNTLGLKKEIIVVNDGSTDNTLNILKKIKLKHKNIKIINNKTNQGKGYSLKQGFLASTGDIVLVQDADLEYSPSDYPFLLSPFIKNNADVVYGSRFISDRPHRVLYFWHYLINQVLTTFSNMLTNLNLTDMETGFKVFNGSLIRKIAPNLKSKRFGFEPEITAKISKIKDIKIFEIGISYFGRTYEEGKKINWIDGIKTFWEIVRFNLLEK